MDKLILLSEAFASRRLPEFRRSVYDDIRWDSQLYTAILGPQAIIF